MVSISASMATLSFNKIFREKIISDDIKSYENKIDKAIFDSRVFTLPKEEVCNCFIWRQQDATRNSIQMVGQANFSHKELHGKSCDKIQDMLFTNKNINWNNLDIYLKRGSCIIKEKHSIDESNTVIRNRWVIDEEIPIFSDNRHYIEKYL